MNTARIKTKLASLEAKAALDKAQTLVVKAEAFKAVTGGIPDSVLNTIQSLLSVAVPLTAVLGDFELTSLLSTLQVWLERKRLDNQQEDLQLTQMQDLGYSNYWTT